MRNPINEVQQLHLLNEIAQGLKVLQSPDLQNKIQAAFGLEESEKAKAEEARQVIAQAGKALADIAAQRKEVADASDLKAQAQAQAKSNQEWADRLTDKEKELTAVFKAQEQEKARLEDYAKSLDVLKGNLEQENIRLSAWQDALNSTAQDMKDRAARAKELLG